MRTIDESSSDDNLDPDNDDYKGRSVQRDLNFGDEGVLYSKVDTEDMKSTQKDMGSPNFGSMVK